jgi:hypothetical protein
MSKIMEGSSYYLPFFLVLPTKRHERLRRVFQIYRYPAVTIHTDIVRFCLIHRSTFERENIIAVYARISFLSYNVFFNSLFNDADSSLHCIASNAGMSRQ